MSVEGISKSATKKNFAQKFGKELEEHLNFGDRLAKSLSNPNICDTQNTLATQLPSHPSANTGVQTTGVSEKESCPSTFTARVREYIERHELKVQNGSLSDKKRELQEIAEASGTSGSLQKSLSQTVGGGSLQENIEKAEERQDSMRNMDYIEKKAVTDPDDRKKHSKKSNSVNGSFEGRAAITLPKRISHSSKQTMKQKNLDILNSSESSQGKKVRSAEKTLSDAKRSESAKKERDSEPSINDSRRSIDMSLGSVKAEKAGSIDASSYLFPNLEKRLSFKKKIISDSIQRLKNSAYTSGAPTRDNSLKSGVFQDIEQTDLKKIEQELALKQALANTSLTFESVDYGKSSEDSFHMRELNDLRLNSKSARQIESILEKINAKGEQRPSEERVERAETNIFDKNQNQNGQEKYSQGFPSRVMNKLEEAEGTMIQLRELFKSSYPEGNGITDSITKFMKRGSFPNIAGSPRDSFSASQLFRQSETESHVMNVSRLNEIEDPNEIQEKLEELRRYSMEMNILGWNGENMASIQDNVQSKGQIGMNHDIQDNEQESACLVSDNMESNRLIDFSKPQYPSDNSLLPVNNTTDEKKIKSLQLQALSTQLKNTSINKEQLKNAEIREANPPHAIEDIKSLRTPDFQTYSSYPRDAQFFILQNTNFQDTSSQDSVSGIRRDTQDQVLQDQSKVTEKVESLMSCGSPKPILNIKETEKSRGSTEGKKMSIIKRFSEELEKGLASKLPLSQVKNQEAQEDKEGMESQEMMGFLSFSKEYGRMDGSEAMQSPAMSLKDEQTKYEHSREVLVRPQFKPELDAREISEEDYRVSNQKEQVYSEQEKQLDDAMSNVNIKTFLALRSILKPHRAIVLCCEGLLKLLAGFEGIPELFQDQESIEWSQIKGLFSSPVKFVNLVSSFKDLIQRGEISYKKMETLDLIISRIQVHLDTQLHEAFNQLYNFLVAAIQYYESFSRQDTFETRKDTFEEPEKVRPVPIQYTEPLVKKAPKNDFTKNKTAAEKPPRVIGSNSRDIPSLPQASKVERNTRSVGRAATKSPLKATKETNVKDSSLPRNSQKQVLNKNVGTKSAPRSPAKQKKQTAGKLVDKREEQNKIQKENRVKEQERDEYNEEEQENIYEDGVRFLVEVELSEAGELRDDIEVAEKEAREYRNKVKKMIVDHDRYVKKFLKEQEELEEEINREHAILDWRKEQEIQQEQKVFERELKHQKEIDFINEIKEIKELKVKEEKENINEYLLESLQDHYYHSFIVQKKKDNKQKELRERCKNVMANRISKKQKETMESISQKEDLAQRRKDHFRHKKIDVETQKNKWKSDYLLLSKLIGNAK